MKNIKHTAIILLTLIVSCRNNSIEKTEESIKNKILIKNEKFIGHWFFDTMNNKDSLKNKTFEINLFKINEDKIQGNYCSVSHNGNKMIALMKMKKIFW